MANLIVEVAAPPGELGAELSSRVFDALEMRLSKGSCYRGRVLSLEAGYQWTGHAARIRVHELEPVSRERLVRDLARRTDGASPAFIKEFLRRVAQHHLNATATGEVSRATAEAALHEMLFSGGVLNTRLGGGETVSSS